MESQNLFFQLEKTKPTDRKNQTEDYFTKILRFVLLNNRNVRRELLRLLFKKHPAVIRKYRGFIDFAKETDILSHSSTAVGIPDLLIGNDRTPRLAIEIKLEAKEGQAQLKKYLNDENNSYVAYISKHYEILSDKYATKSKYLGAFRWYELFKKIEKYRKDDRITKHFIEYMKIRGMNTKMTINKKHINVWGRYAELEDIIAQHIKKLIEYMGKKDSVKKIKEMTGREYHGIRFLTKKSRWHNFNNMYFFAGFHRYFSGLSFSVEFRVPRQYWHWSKGLETKVPIEDNNEGKIYRGDYWFVISKPIEKIIDISSNSENKQYQQMCDFIERSTKQLKRYKYLKEFFAKGW